MVTMNIKDPEVHRLANVLAQRRHVSATRAVRQALEEALEHDRAARSGIASGLMMLAERSHGIEEPFLDDQDLYDDRGLPR